MEAFLVSDEAHGKTHSELERELEQQGRELLRRLYQAHLERRAPGEATAAVRDSQGPCNRSSSDTSLATSSSLSLEIRCCIDRLNPHLKADIQVSRGKRHQVSTQTPIGGPPWSRTRRSPQPPSTSPGNAGRSWARLLRKVYEVDALECPQCGCRLRIIAVIEQRSVIQQILQHLDLWELPQRAPPPRLFPHKLRDLPGFAFAPAGSSRPSLQRRALLGRRPDLGRLSSAGAQAGSRTRVSLSALIFPFLQPKLGLDAPLGLFHSAFSFTSGPSAPSSLLDPFLHPQ